MKQLIVVFICFSFFAHNSLIFSQTQHTIDSLNFLLQASKEDTNKVRLLLTLGQEYEDKNPKKTAEYYLKALEISEKINDPLYKASCLEYLGIIYQAGFAKYDSAEMFYRECLIIRKETLGEKDIDHAIALNNLADLYLETGNYSKAEPLALRVKELLKEIIGEKHVDYAVSLNQLALLYKRLGNYSKAEILYVEAMNIRREVLGDKDPDYAASLNNLGCLYYEQGNYLKAEPLFIQAKEIRKLVLGEKHIDYSESVNNLANVYNDLGNYSKAEQLLLQSIEIRKEVFGENHPLYATTLNNLANLYQKIGNNSQAEVLYLQATEIRKNVLGIKHPGYASSLNNLAFLYKNIGDYSKAEALYLKAKDIRKEILGEKHQDNATSLHNLASLYFAMGNYSKAETFYLQSDKITKETLGEKHPKYGINLNGLASLYYAMGNSSVNSALATEKYTEAEPLFLHSMEILFYNIDKQFDFLSEKEQEEYLKTVSKNFSDYQGFFLKRKTSNPSITGPAYNLVLWTKRMLLNSGLQMKQKVLNSGDSDLVAIYDQWESKKKWLAKLYSTPITKRKANPDTIEEEANNLEKELTNRSLLFSIFRSTYNKNYLDVKNALNPGEAAIEFASFEITDNKGKETDSILYCALVLKKDFIYPQMIPLFRQHQMDTLLKQSFFSEENYVAKLYGRGLILSINQEQMNKGIQLYKLCWDPFDSLLSDVKTIYYSPSGILHKISFAAIPYNNRILLSEKYNLVCLSSTSKIAEKEQEKFHPMNITLYGGVIYDIDSLEMKTLAQSVNRKSQSTEIFSYNSFRSLPGNLNRSGGWNYLKGTEEEVKIIEEISNKNNIKTNLINGRFANEESLKILSGKNAPNILHIASHGFFFPNPKGSSGNEINDLNQIFHLSENPLFRSGVILAGANRAWKGKPLPDGVDDGILTAYEVSNLNFMDTKLVVLSACETGLGEIKGSEGVYGLQRAFHKAGVKYLIMSLWKVPDLETVDFMKTFYTELFSGTSVPDAFNRTQRIMQKKHLGDPYKWAAFVLVE